MPYVQGPLLLQDQSNIQVNQSTYDFTDWTINQLQWVDSTLVEWDEFLDDAAVLLSEPSDPWPGIDLNGAIDELSVYWDPQDLLGVPELISALGIADAGLAAAIGFAPIEAWVNPATPFVTPIPSQVIAIPTIPPDAIDFTVTGSVSAAPGTTPPAGTSGAPTVSLTNTTSFGNPNFKVGDNYLVSVTGPPGATVSVSGSVQGNGLPYSNQGTIGSDGTWSLSGQMQPDGVGIWDEVWYVNGGVVGAFSFVVVN
jgi:hypothetical protein